jgi:hypothetical protein
MNAWKIVVGLFLTIPLNGLAEVYQSTHADGSISYSDTPSNNATVVKVADGDSVKNAESKITITEEGIETKTADAVQPADFQYKSLRFVSPTADQTFWNEHDIPVMVSVSPALRSTDKVQITVDGNPQPAQPTTQFTLQNVVRGSHKIKAVILDKDNAVLTETPEVIINVHFGSRKQANEMTTKAINVVSSIAPILFQTKAS